MGYLFVEKGSLFGHLGPFMAIWPSGYQKYIKNEAQSLKNEPKSLQNASPEQQKLNMFEQGPSIPAMSTITIKFHLINKKQYQVCTQ